MSNEELSYAVVAEDVKAQVMGLVERYDGLTITDLCELTGFKASYMQKAVIELMKEKRLQRRRMFSGTKGQPPYEYRTRDADIEH